MASNITFTMIKPDAVASGHIGAILAQINNAGFKIIALKYTKLSAEKAGEFYDIHRERGFFGELVDIITSTILFQNEYNFDLVKLFYCILLVVHL